MKTIVYNDINNSPFCFMTHGINFYFSSSFNKERFLRSYEQYILEENIKIKNKYHVNIKLDTYLLVALYKKIEKRGFKIEDATGLLTENPIFISNILYF